MRSLIAPPLREYANFPQVWLRWFSSLFKSVPISGSVTITPGAATTVVNIKDMSSDSTVLMFPSSSTAVSVDLAITYAVSGDGLFTIYHANSATTGRTFNYMVQV